jgi:hypothetical protein
MKKNYILITAVMLVMSITQLKAQTTWTGARITFTKANNADWLLATNQDRINNNVWITRANNQGVFNIASENNYTDFFSPADTEWAIGIASNSAMLTFQNWEDSSGSNPPSLVNQDMVLHLITDDIYIDLKFTSWQSGGAGGGFSYERSTDQSLSSSEFEFKEKIKLFPNPANKHVKITGLTNLENYTIYSITGALMSKGTISNEELIDITELNNGLYFLKIKNGNTLRFLKK